MVDWNRDEVKTYPDDFQGILNEVEMYICPTSERRIIVSNGIPSHDVHLWNNNDPCEIHWAVSVSSNKIN